MAEQQQLSDYSQINFFITSAIDRNDPTEFTKALPLCPSIQDENDRIEIIRDAFMVYIENEELNDNIFDGLINVWPEIMQSTTALTSLLEDSYVYASPHIFEKIASTIKSLQVFYT